MSIDPERIHQLIKRRSKIRRLGPFIFTDDRAWAALLKHEDERKKIIGEVDMLEHDGARGTFWAPTAAHAAVFLEHLLESFKIRGGQEDDVCITLLFRGHRNDAWKIGTTLQRAADQAFAVRNAELFTGLMSEIGNSVLAVKLPASIYEAVSQHYQCDTNLLDFTPDPHVAVHFAALKHPDPAAHACVLFAPMATLTTHGAQVLLPPPMFDRIQRQRGVFVKTPSSLPDSLFSRIVFPANTGFPVYRNGRAVELLAEPRWIRTARSLTRKVALRPAKEGEMAELLQSLVAARKDVPYGNRIAENMGMTELAIWLDYYEEMRYWLACTINPDKEYFWPEPLELLARFNPELVDLHGRFVRLVGRPY